MPKLTTAKGVERCAEEDYVCYEGRYGEDVGLVERHKATFMICLQEDTL